MIIGCANMLSSSVCSKCNASCGRSLLLLWNAWQILVLMSFSKIWTFAILEVCSSSFLCVHRSHEMSHNFFINSITHRLLDLCILIVAQNFAYSVCHSCDSLPSMKRSHPSQFCWMTACKFVIGKRFAPEYQLHNPAIIASTSLGSVFAEHSHPSRSCIALFQHSCAVGAEHQSMCCLSCSSCWQWGQWLAILNRHLLIFLPCANSPVASLVTHFHLLQGTSVMALHTASQSTCAAVPFPNWFFFVQWDTMFTPLMWSHSVSIPCFMIFFDPNGMPSFHMVWPRALSQEFSSWLEIYEKRIRSLFWNEAKTVKVVKREFASKGRLNAQGSAFNWIRGEEGDWTLFNMGG